MIRPFPLLRACFRFFFTIFVEEYRFYISWVAVCFDCTLFLHQKYSVSFQGEASTTLGLAF